jgi:hypothetical protein
MRAPDDSYLAARYHTIAHSILGGVRLESRGSEAEADADAHTTAKAAAAHTDPNTSAWRVIAGAISVCGITVAIIIRRSDDTAGETGP